MLVRPCVEAMEGAARSITGMATLQRLYKVMCRSASFSLSHTS